MGRASVTRIDVLKGTGTRYRSVLHRADGVVVELDGGGYNVVGGPARRVPHDIAHLVVERRLGLDAGLWGVLAGGGIVQNASFVGRLPPHALRRAKAQTDPQGETLRQAEVLVRAVADRCLAHGPSPVTPGELAALRRAVGDRWWASGTTASALASACLELRDASVRWEALPAGESLALEWPAAGPRTTRR
ncbi:hypothetical protein [Patulibacter americanus]|uniref:hypothetical protein n=1 Tax=Patulibacter americanus TaxID=588672 RepID=UPI0003B49012|nr:hypothetical protein [Patulibacter americanus]